MKIEFDPIKSAKNVEERELPFTRAADLDWDGAVVTEDTRHEYLERRFVAAGHIGERLHILCFTPIEGGCGSSASGKPMNAR